MEIHSTMTNAEWKDLLNYLTAQGALITEFAKQDNNGDFIEFKYATIEYKDEFYSIGNPLNMFEAFTATRYTKVSPYEKQQNAYPVEVRDTDQLLKYMNEEHRQKPLKDTYKQRIFNLYGISNGRTALWHLANELAGYREKNILRNLKSISMRQNTNDYQVIRFIANDGDYFDYEIKSKRIVG